MGYRVTFGPTSTSARTTETVTGTDMRTFTASDLIPRTQYTFEIIPFSETGDGESADYVTRQTTLPSGIYASQCPPLICIHTPPRSDVSVGRAVLL